VQGTTREAPGGAAVLPEGGSAGQSDLRATLVGMREVPADMAAKLTNAASTFVSSFEEVRMEDIAAAAGVSRTSLYYYFAGKDDILAFLLRAMLDDLTRVAVGAATRPGTPPERLGAVIRAQLGHLNAHPTLSQLLIANLGRAGKLPDIAARVNDGFIEPVKRLLSEGAADGSLRTLADDDLGASALFGAVLVIGLRSLVTDGSIDVDRVMAMVGPMFWNGIAPHSGDPLPT
jgi:AcrR family transcriptional regulator